MIIHTVTTENIKENIKRCGADLLEIESLSHIVEIFV